MAGVWTAVLEVVSMQKKRKNVLTGIQKKIFGCYFLMVGILTAIIVTLFLFLVREEISSQADNRGGNGRKGQQPAGYGSGEYGPGCASGYWG